MPYSISTEAKDCNGFAVIKEDDKKLWVAMKPKKKLKIKLQH